MGSPYANMGIAAAQDYPIEFSPGKGLYARVKAAM
jgi:hypothetical protein